MTVRLDLLRGRDMVVGFLNSNVNHHLGARSLPSII